MSDLRLQLRDALPDLSVEREIEGGGMSRVFVATDPHDRRIVIKVLAPELSVGLARERFQREVRVAARLQHPHVVPLLASGEVAGLPFFTMPFVEGESLRQRLTRERELPVDQVIALLSDVADALAYAHERGVVHRDIKPENLLLTGGHAQVADFGIAKAIRTATDPGGGGLTSTGVALGTPGYMAPEQGAGDPLSDHRVDIYAFGVVAYEMLAGDPPFGHRSPVALMAAHAMERPPDVTSRRSAVPAGLSALVMRCLAKVPADRPQSAQELRDALEAVRSSVAREQAGRNSPAGTGSMGLATRLLALVSGVALLTLGLQRVVGIPDWALPAALIIAMVIAPGAGWLHQRQLLRAAHGEHLPSGERRTRAWRRVVHVAAVALGLLVVVSGGYLISRTTGIGPAGTLLSTGRMLATDRVVVTDLDAGASDSLTARALSEALRTELSETGLVEVVTRTELDQTLARMELPVNQWIDAALGRQVALRARAKAVLSGGMTAVGSGFLVTLRLASVQGEELVAVTERASTADDLISAVGRATRELRNRIGESLRTLQSARPLEDVTTRSMRALELFTQAQDLSRRLRVDQNDQTIALLEQAVQVDSTFAMAHRRLGIALRNVGRYTEALRSLRLAERHSDRASDVERLTAAATLAEVLHDYPTSTAHAEQVLRLQPGNEWVYSELNRNYNMLGRTAEAESVAALFSRRFGRTFSTASSLLYQGRSGEAIERSRALLTRAEEADDTVEARARRTDVVRAFAAAGGFDSAASVFADKPPSQAYHTYANLALGRLLRTWQIAGTNPGVPGSTVPFRWRAIAAAAIIGGTPERYLAQARAAVTDSAWLDGAVSDRDVEPIMSLAIAGDPSQAGRLLQEIEAAAPADVRIARRHQFALARGVVALAAGRPTEAITALRSAERDALHGFTAYCKVCAFPWMSRAYEAMGATDSAIAVAERFLDSPDAFRQWADAQWRAPTLEWLGRRYMERGDTAKAVRALMAFIEQWKGADPELQPRVADARRKLQVLGGDAAQAREARRP
jgi:eukaryotic-like serine/threonine-protein kinase